MEIYFIIIGVLLLALIALSFVILKKQKSNDMNGIQKLVDDSLKLYQHQLESTQNMLREIGNNQAKMIELYIGGKYGVDRS